MNKQATILIDYVEKIHQRTARLVQLIPKEKIDWTFTEDRFTLGDMIRHIAATQRFMYAENVQFRPSKYVGCGKDLAATYEAVMVFYEENYKQSLAIFRTLTDEDLSKKCLSPAGIEISIGNWLRAMIEHEIHHRGQLYIYLALLGIKTPPIFGLTEAELATKGI